MKRGTALFLLLATFFLPEAALARPKSIPDPIHYEAALALIHFPWQQLGYEIVFMPPQRGYRAMTFARTHRIEIYVRPGDTAELLAFDIAHELGHVIDLTQNTSDIRAKWMESRGIDPSTPWFGCNRCSDLKTPAGDFAETFALLLFGAKNYSGKIAPAPTKDQIPVLYEFFPKEWFTSTSQAN